MDRNNLVWIGANDSGNEIDQARRVAYGLMAPLLVRQEYNVDPARVYLHGFSQACALNFRFALTYPETLRGFIGICGGIPSDLAENALYRPAAADVLYLYSDNDDFYPLEKFEDFASRLGSYLPSFESKRSAAGHEITYVIL